MCDFLLALYPDSEKDEILALSSKDLYAKSIVVKLESGDPGLERIRRSSIWIRDLGRFAKIKAGRPYASFGARL
jgi:hypothetical protein